MTSSPLAIIQARMSSSRLPGKILAEIEGKPLLAHVIARARAIKGIDDVVVAVPDAYTQQTLKHYGIPSIATPKCAESDVLCRYATIAEQFRSHDVIVRLTADCPLLDPAIAEHVLSLYYQSKSGYAWNDTRHSGYPDGCDVEVFGRDLLALAHGTATQPADLEHVTCFMRRVVKPAVLKAKEPWTGPKLSVDTAEDLERVRAIMAKLPKGDYSLAATWKAAQVVVK